jgi:hypothetical protein
MGPGMFPRVIALLVGVCGGALGLRSWLQLPPEQLPPAPLPAQSLFAQSLPAQSLPAQSLPAQSLLAQSLPKGGSAARAVSGQRVWRAPLCLLLAAMVFGLSVRPLGLVVATPLSLLLAALASPDSRRQQSLWFALGMTVFCVLLFRQLLSLPIPLAPWLLGY